MSDVCKKEYECGGNCWANVACVCSVWEECSNHYKGTEEHQNLLNDVFECKNGKIKEDIVKEFKLDEIKTHVLRNVGSSSYFKNLMENSLIQQQLLE